MRELLLSRKMGLLPGRLAIPVMLVLLPLLKVLEPGR
jgi:hypothetical protein